jgi:hypothetical protein
MNSWFLSGFVNLLAAGIAAATARAQVLTWVPTADQSAASTTLSALTAACTTAAGLAPAARYGAGSTPWGYILESPFQTYVHL